MRADHATKALAPAPRGGCTNDRGTLGGGNRVRPRFEWATLGWATLGWATLGWRTRERPARRRAVAAGGALIAQLWGLGIGAPGAFAAATDPIRVPASRTVLPPGGGSSGSPADGTSGRPAGGEAAGTRPDGGAAGADGTSGRHGGRARNGAPGDRGNPSPDPGDPTGTDEASGTGGTGQAGASGRSGSGPSAGRAESPGLLGGLTGAAGAPVTGLDDPAAAVGDILQERIRAGGLPLPLPGQSESVPDAFALASGLLSAVPAQGQGQGRPVSPRASRDTVVAGGAQSQGAGTDGGAGRGASAAGRQRGPAAPPPAPDGRRLQQTAAGYSEFDAGGHDGGAEAGSLPAQRTAGREFAFADPAAVPAGHGTPGTGPAVLAPITAGLLLTGAAMYKHRGLPRGH